MGRFERDFLIKNFHTIIPCDDLPYKKNDNLTALAMQHCALQICEGIEVDDTKKIASALADLKQCTENFEAIFYDNLINNRYRS